MKVRRAYYKNESTIIRVVVDSFNHFYYPGCGGWRYMPDYISCDLKYLPGEFDFWDSSHTNYGFAGIWVNTITKGDK